MIIPIDRQNDVPRITENGKLVYSEKSDTLYIRTLKEGTKAIGGNTSIVETDPVFTAWLATPPNVSIFTNDAGYLTSFSETDPIFSLWQSNYDNHTDWDTAYGWGNHASAGYLTSYTETDPVFTTWLGTNPFSSYLTSATAASTYYPIPVGTTAQYIRGNGSLATFPTTVSSFTNDSAYITASALSPYLTSATAAATYQPIGSYLTTQKGAFGLTLSGTLTTGSKGYVILPYNCTVTKWYITADVSGSIVIDVKKSGVSIVGAGNKPTLSGVSNNSANISGWTTSSLVDGDVLEFNVDSVATVTKVTLTIKITI